MLCYEETSANAAVASVLSEMDSSLPLKEEHENVTDGVSQ